MYQKGGNRKSPFVKGDLEGFPSAQHHFDEIQIHVLSALQSV